MGKVPNETARKKMWKGTAWVLIFALLLTLMPYSPVEAGKKIKKVAIKNTDSGVIVMKKKSQVSLNVALNGKVTKKAWRKVTFRSQKKKIVSVNKKGIMMARKKGTTRITVTSKKTKKKAVVKVIVGTPITFLKIKENRKTLQAGERVRLKTIVRPARASYKKVRWTSKNTTVATVSQKGYVTAHCPGKTYITATALDGTRKKASCQITVHKTANGGGTAETIQPEQQTSTPEPVVKPTEAPGQPTSTPEVKPTPMPTVKPTSTPVVKPTEAPGQPTSTPEVKPTPMPTVKPTSTPTPTPVVKPTEAPGQPTSTPEVKPTPMPTVKPTSTPTPMPTVGPTSTPIPTATPEPQTVMTEDCNKMTCGGSYAGAVSKPFAGVALYGNGDYCLTSYAFEGTNKKYRLIVKGASNNSTTASVSVYVGGVKKGSLSFTGTDLSTQSFDFKMLEDTGLLEIKFLMEKDTGANDIYLKSFELQYLGDIPELPPAPEPAEIGAVYTGNYRNMFSEMGYSQAEIDAKVEAAWQQLFYGDDTERIYYPVENDMAYIYTADTDDVRSEGMSYGMMICVQLDKKEEFDRLWKWAKTNMQHTSGEFKDYFAWQCKPDGSKISNTPASDGEEYFATALLFASARWGNGEGIYNYNEQAQIILKAMLHQKDDGQGVNLFDSTYKMPVFCPIGNAATYTDPSYHLPAFYEVWAEMSEQDNDFWVEAAAASREYFKKATNSTTGLGPDYSEFSGVPKNEGNHGDFRFDAWRIASNIACDYAWWGKDTWATTHANTLQSFFSEKGMENYGNQWSLDGKELGTDHSPGLVAMNAVASLAADKQQAWAFLEELWNISTTTGKYRYYDGCLYLMGLLHCSGKFRAYFPEGCTPSRDTSGKITPAQAEYDLNVEKSSDVLVHLILGGERTLQDIKNAELTLREGTDYEMDGDKVTIKKEYLSQFETGTVTLRFIFDAGKDAILTIAVKDTTGGGTVTGPFDKIPASAFSNSNDVTVQDGIVTFNTADSWVAFNVDFGVNAVKTASVYVKEPNNSGQIYIYQDTLTNQVSTIYNLGNGSWKETSNNCTITSGEHTVYVKANKAGVMMEWLQFTAK